MGTFTSQASFAVSHCHDIPGEPLDIGSCAGSDMQKASSHSCDSSHLHACDMPSFDFGAGTTDIAQLGAWEPDFDAQSPHCQPGINAEAMPHNSDGSWTAQSEPLDWCDLIAQGFEVNSQSALDMPQLPLLSEKPPSLTIGWQQARQAEMQSQQCEQQHLHHESQQQQQQQPYLALPQPLAAEATCSNVVALNVSCTESGGSGPGVDWWMLPCSMDNMFQANAIPPSGTCRLWCSLLRVELACCIDEHSQCYAEV